MNVVQDALQASDDAAAIEVISARPGWVELLVPCTREAAEQIHPVIERLGADLPADVIESVSDAFRELLHERGRVGRPAGSRRGPCASHACEPTGCCCTGSPILARASRWRISITPRSRTDDPIVHARIREEKGLRAGGFGLLTGSGQGR